MSNSAGEDSLQTGQRISKGRGRLFQKLLPSQKLPIFSDSSSDSTISSLCFAQSKQKGTQFDDSENNHDLGNFDENYKRDYSKSKKINLAKFDYEDEDTETYIDDDSKPNQRLSSIRMDNPGLLSDHSDDDNGIKEESRTVVMIKKNFDDLMDEYEHNDEEDDFCSTNETFPEKTKNKNCFIMNYWNKKYSSIDSFTSSSSTSNSVAKSFEANPESNPLTKYSGTEHLKFENPNKNNSSSSSSSSSYPPRQTNLEILAKNFASAYNKKIDKKTIFNRRKSFAQTKNPNLDLSIKKDDVLEEISAEEVKEESEDEETKNLKFIERFRKMVSTHHDVLVKDEEDEAKNLDRITFNQLESAQIYYESKSPDDILPPIESFRMMLRTSLKIFENYQPNLIRFNLHNLTAIQQYIIPNIVNGCLDLLVSAPTGTGKTLAYLLSAVQLICEYRGIGNSPSNYRLSTDHPLALIIVPTHELANQVYHILRLLVGDLPIRLMFFHGSQSLTDQTLKIENGLDIVISTPGRFLHLTDIKQLFFGKFKFIFIDEIDNLLVLKDESKQNLILSKFFQLIDKDNYNSQDIGIEDCSAVPPGLKSKIQNQLKRPRFFLFSATVVGKTRVQSEQFVAPNYAFFVMGDKAKSSNSNIKQIFIPIDDSSDKNFELIKLLEKFYTRYDQILIFVHTARHADQLSDYLNQNQFQSVSIHSNLPQQIREQAIGDFYDKTIHIAVSTFLFSRELNICAQCTILYDLPHNLTNYINCIGRIGRMENFGISVTLFQTYSRSNLALVPELINLLEDSNQSIPQFMLDLQNRYFYSQSK